MFWASDAAYVKGGNKQNVAVDYFKVVWAQNWLPGPRLIPTSPTGSAQLCLADLLSFISADFPRATSLIALMMEALQTSETLVNSHQSTRRNIPEDSHLQNTPPLQRSTST
jgi:hypothetical protein